MRFHFLKHHIITHSVTYTSPHSRNRQCRSNSEIIRRNASPTRSRNAWISFFPGVLFATSRTCRILATSRGNMSATSGITNPSSSGRIGSFHFTGISVVGECDQNTCSRGKAFLDLMINYCIPTLCLTHRLLYSLLLPRCSSPLTDPLNSPTIPYLL